MRRGQRAEECDEVETLMREAQRKAIVQEFKEHARVWALVVLAYLIVCVLFYLMGWR